MSDTNQDDQQALENFKKMMEEGTFEWINEPIEMPEGRHNYHNVTYDNLIATPDKELEHLLFKAIGVELKRNMKDVSNYMSMSYFEQRTADYITINEHKRKIYSALLFEKEIEKEGFNHKYKMLGCEPLLKEVVNLYKELNLTERCTIISEAYYAWKINDTDVLDKSTTKYFALNDGAEAQRINYIRERNLQFVSDGKEIAYQKSIPKSWEYKMTAILWHGFFFISSMGLSFFIIMQYVDRFGAVNDKSMAKLLALASFAVPLLLIMKSANWVWDKYILPKFKVENTDND